MALSKFVGELTSYPVRPGVVVLDMDDDLELSLVRSHSTAIGALRPYDGRKHEVSICEWCKDPNKITGFRLFPVLAFGNVRIRATNRDKPVGIQYIVLDQDTVVLDIIPNDHSLTRNEFEAYVKNVNAFAHDMAVDYLEEARRVKKWKKRGFCDELIESGKIIAVWGEYSGRFAHVTVKVVISVNDRSDLMLQYLHKRMLLGVELLCVAFGIYAPLLMLVNSGYRLDGYKDHHQLFTWFESIIDQFTLDSFKGCYGFPMAHVGSNGFGRYTKLETDCVCKVDMKELDTMVFHDEFVFCSVGCWISSVYGFKTFSEIFKLEFSSEVKDITDKLHVNCTHVHLERALYHFLKKAPFAVVVSPAKKDPRQQ